MGRKKILIRQENNFPETPSTKLIVDLAGKGNFNLKLRSPKWTNPSEVNISINGKKQNVQPDGNGYFTLTKKWKRRCDRNESSDASFCRAIA